MTLLFSCVRSTGKVQLESITLTSSKDLPAALGGHPSCHANTAHVPGPVCGLRGAGAGTVLWWVLQARHSGCAVVLAAVCGWHGSTCGGGVGSRGARGAGRGACSGGRRAARPGDDTATLRPSLAHARPIGFESFPPIKGLGGIYHCARDAFVTCESL